MTYSKRISYCTLFALTALLFLSTYAFAGDPIPGVNVGAGKNPGGKVINVKTDKDGKFKFPPTDSGSYTITFPNDEKFLSFNVLFDRGFKVFVNGKEWPTYHTMPVRPGEKLKVSLHLSNHEPPISGAITTADTTK